MFLFILCRKAWYPVDLTPTKESDDNIGKIPSPGTQFGMLPTATPSSVTSHLTSEALRSHDAKQKSARPLIGQSSLEGNNGASQSTTGSSLKPTVPQNAKFKVETLVNRQR